MFRKGLKLILAILLIFFLVFLVNILQVYSYSKQSFETKADVAVVLGAGTSNGELSPVFRERINHSINLLKKGTVDYILLTGGIGEGEKVSDSSVGKQYALENGVTEHQILLEEESRITIRNICNAKKIMDENNLKSALIISDPYHMKRAMKMCEKIGIEALPSPTPTTMYRTGKVKRRFLINQAWNYWLFVLFQQHSRYEC